jgi:hypothetical protein
MFEQIKDLLQDVQLRQKIKEAKTQDEGIKLLTTAGAEKGGNFTISQVTQMLTQFVLQQKDELSEEDLLAVGGGAMALTTGTKSWCSCNDWH